MGLVMAATRPERLAGVVLNDAGPELDPAGIQRIARYVGHLGAVANWTEAAAQAKNVYGSALPGLTDAQWLAYAQRGYRENSQGIPVLDMDPNIANAFRHHNSTPVDLWAVFAQIKTVPLLVIRGALSDLLAPTTVARMALEKPGLRHVTVAQRGHAPLLDEPECIAAIDEFLSINGQES
jgi:pimeloyl-ACP methyl ester carboxylesterase